jgi:predicted RNA methylase
MEFAGERLWNQYGMSEFKFNNASPVILDIGANIGEFSIYASNKFNAQVYSFEPDPVAYKLMLAITDDLKATLDTSPDSIVAIDNVFDGMRGFAERASRKIKGG